MPIEMKPSEIIAGALGLMQRHGPKGGLLPGNNWTQGEAHGYTQEHEGGATEDVYCALGALSTASGIKATDDARHFTGPLKEAAELVANSMPADFREEGYGYNAISIPEWNDADETRFPAIKRVFCSALRKAIKIENPKMKVAVKRKAKTIKKAKKKR